MFANVNWKQAVSVGVISGFIGLVVGFAVCVHEVRSMDATCDIRTVHPAPLPAGSAITPGDIESHELTEDDLTRCRHALPAGVFPDVLVTHGQGIDIVDYPATKYTDDQLRSCQRRLDSLAGLESTQ